MEWSRVCKKSNMNTLEDTTAAKYEEERSLPSSQNMFQVDEV